MSDVTTDRMFQHESERMLSMAFTEALKSNGVEDGVIGRSITTFFNKYLNGFAEALYKPDAALVTRISDYIEWCQNQEDSDQRVNTTEAGQLMEEIAVLAFKCLQGWDSIRSYRSYSQQHDFVISGNDTRWFMLMNFLHLPDEGRMIVVEAKNLQEVISDEVFTRLCHKIQNTFQNLCHLGVFLTRNGASGFPKRDGVRKESLQNARATQVIFHAITHNKYVVVLDHEDIIRLTSPGALPLILEAKISEVEAATGLPYDFTDNWLCVDLPPHLEQYFSPQAILDE